MYYQSFANSDGLKIKKDLVTNIMKKIQRCWKSLLFDKQQ
jgi:hypothetical protein